MENKANQDRQRQCPRGDAFLSPARPRRHVKAINLPDGAHASASFRRRNRWRRASIEIAQALIRQHELEPARPLEGKGP
jgi:hypothetical protein